MNGYRRVALIFMMLISLQLLSRAQTPAPSGGSVVMASATKGNADERAEQLLKQMTLDEKMSLVSGAGFSTHAIARLGIPRMEMSDGPAGVRNGPGKPSPRACAFPAGAALAATWDAALAEAYGKAIGREGRARGTHFQLGPGLNICRVPINGRNFEYFGEDPCLASVIAAGWVKGCSEQGVVPTIKHFAANNQEQYRMSVDARVDERTLHEIYFPAFKGAIDSRALVAVMCSYNRLNGHYASNNDWLLNQVLKKQWGFKGLVMSDWGASHDTTDLARGLDLEMPDGKNLSAQKINTGLSSGTLTLASLDDAVLRILRTAAAAGWLDSGWQQKQSALPLDSPDSAKVALEVAQDSIVLLKNERNALPLNRAKLKKIVVLGPNATADSGQVPANIGGGGSGAVMPFAERFDEADYLKGITKAAGAGVQVVYLALPAKNAEQSLPDMSAVKTADAAIVCVGLNKKLESEGRDRAFELPLIQRKLIAAVCAANPRTIVINNSGAAVGMAGWQKGASAILQAWYLGQEGGLAIGKVLFGEVNPSGRLCSTFDKNFEENPAFSAYPGKTAAGARYPVEPYTEGIFYGYRGYDKAGNAPLYPFGFGLSYTTFKYSGMKVERAGTETKVSLDVKNTGKRAGAEVVQIYVGERRCPIARPLRELKGFSKVMLKPGETRRVEIILPSAAFAYWSPSKKDWAIDIDNTFTIEAAASERDIKLKQTIKGL